MMCPHLHCYFFNLRKDDTEVKRHRNGCVQKWIRHVKWGVDAKERRSFLVWKRHDWAQEKPVGFVCTGLFGLGLTAPQTLNIVVSLSVILILPYELVWRWWWVLFGVLFESLVLFLSVSVCLLCRFNPWPVYSSLLLKVNGGKIAFQTFEPVVAMAELSWSLVIGSI